MHRIERLGPIARRPNCGAACDAANRDAGPVVSGFPATLLAMAGHDLRQPLQVITSAHEVLATMLCGTREREELERSVDATAQLERMLTQLVEALHLQERPREEPNEPVPLRPLLDDLKAEFGELARRKGIAFRVAAGRNEPLSHPVLLSSILRNLIRNAIDYTPPGGRVFVGSRRNGPELRLEVRDTGIGIRAGALTSMFDAFQRKENTGTEGLGLGLFIVKRAADLLGHRIEVQSREGCGSRFTVVARAGRSRYPKPGIGRGHKKLQLGAGYVDTSGFRTFEAMDDVAFGD
jgi:two-component system, OmpR family, phosphate regulon sensor histidine kinase PhoR